MEQLCLFALGELGERIPIPSGYHPSSGMTDYTINEWIQRVETAMLDRELSWNLGEKILVSLDRLPLLLTKSRIAFKVM